MLDIPGGTGTAIQISALSVQRLTTAHPPPSLHRHFVPSAGPTSQRPSWSCVEGRCTMFAEGPEDF